MRSSVTLLVGVFLLFDLGAAVSAPPLCDDPAAVPAEWAQIYHSELITNIGFDGNFVFVAAGSNLERTYWNGAQQVAEILPYGVGSAKINVVSQRVYVAEVLDTPVHVLDYDLNELTVLFTADPSALPGGMVGSSFPIAIHPDSGDLYVLSSGNYVDQGNPPTTTWISRIQRFDQNGNYEGFVINNQLTLSPDDSGFNQSNPPMPACGAWHYPERLWVDAQGNLYLRDRVNSDGERVVIHKFAPAGTCEDVWDVTNKVVGIDRDGYVYTGVGNVVSKHDPSRTELLYQAVMATPFPIREIVEAPHATEFTRVSSRTTDDEEPIVTHVLGPHVEALAIIGKGWQDTAEPYRLRTDDVELLTACDEDKLIMDGVVADGVSPLLVRWKVPGPGVMRWELKDPDNPNANSLLGTLTNVDSSVQDTLMIQTGVENVDGEYFAFAVYAAPMNFDRVEVPGDASASQRTVRVWGRYFPTGTGDPPLSVFRDLRVERPPVLFVHGMWASPTTWNEFGSISTSPLWRNSRIHYGTDTGRGLQHHLDHGTVAKGVANARELVSPLVAVAQVEVVVHSLGGLLVRDYAGSGTYVAPTNYGYGDFHKVLFLNTPHLGSPEADAAAGLRDFLITDPLHTPPIGIGRRVASLVGLKGLVTSFDSRLEQLMGKSLDDLRPGSSALAALEEFTVPSHAHVGDAWRFWSPITAPHERAFAMRSEPSAVLAWVFSNILNQDILPDPSDLIVPVESQVGGLAEEHYLTVDALVEGIHTAATRSQYAGDLALEWARRRPDDETFFAPSVPAPDFSGMSAPKTTTQDLFASLPDFGGTELSITVVDPPGGGTTFPGKVIRVRLEGPLFNSSSATICYPGGSVGLQYSDLNGQNGASIVIPLEHVGPFELVAVANREGRVFASPPVTLMVDLAAKSPPITVEGIRVEPSSVVLGGPGATQNLAVIAECSDGIEREVGPSGLGTTYSGTGAYFLISPDGVVIGKLPGTQSFTVSNSGHVVSVPVTVLDGPQFNNAPHADAGGSYEACDGQVVFLDGSGSYDLDENLGETLTFAWDLDADGQFDDANGQAPAVELDFPGQYWLLGLQVTDSQGLESVDYALLEAAPGCLDGEFVCARSSGSENDWAAQVGTDASGTIYVAEESDLADIKRIVKFSLTCDSLASFPVSRFSPGLAVGPDGTCYIPESLPDGIWKYTGSGTESFLPLPVYLSELAVDGSGNIYGRDNSAWGLVRKYDPAGTAITTWNASQATGTTFPIWQIAVGPNEEIYVASSDRIARGILQGGSYVLDWVTGQAGVDAGSFDQIQGLAVGPSGNVYVSDADNNRVQRFTSDGMFDRMWMGSGKPTNGGFERPQSIAIGTAEQVVVVDRQLSSTWPLRIQIFGTETSVVTAELEAFTDDGVNPLAPNATLPASGCPEGDGDHLVVTVAIDPSEVAGPIPASALVLVLPSGGAAVSYAPVNADEDATLVNGMYRTTFTMRKFGGCQSSDVVVALNGVGIGSVPVVLRSPDWEAGGSDGAVNLGDFAWFGGHYTSPPKPYSECADHRAAYGAVNLGDFGHFGAHYAHTSGGGSLLSGTLPAADGTLRVELEESNPVVGERRLWARLVLEGVEPFKAMVVALRNEHPDLEYLGWTPSAAYANGTACIELTRGGVKQVFLGVMGTGGVSGGSVELGRVEFAIQGDEALTLTDEDLSFLNAELLSSADKVLAFSGLRLERTINAPSYEFELAQNYPNPFNPSTTIAYSLAQASDVELTIFDVRGSHVKTVVRERRDAGVHRAPWDGTDNRGNRVASGVYFYRLTAGSFRATKKMVLLR